MARPDGVYKGEEKWRSQESDRTADPSGSPDPRPTAHCSGISVHCAAAACTGQFLSPVQSIRVRDLDPSSGLAEPGPSSSLAAAPFPLCREQAGDEKGRGGGDGDGAEGSVSEGSESGSESRASAIRHAKEDLAAFSVGMMSSVEGAGHVPAAAFHSLMHASYHHHTAALVVNPSNPQTPAEGERNSVSRRDPILSSPGAGIPDTGGSPWSSAKDVASVDATTSTLTTSEHLENHANPGTCHFFSPSATAEVDRRGLRTDCKKRQGHSVIAPKLSSGNGRKKHGTAAAAAAAVEAKVAASSASRGFSRRRAPSAWDERGKLVLLVLLYLIQGVPLGLTTGALPFMLQAKLSFTQVALFSTATYPYSLKLLWSPIVDSLYVPAIGRRKSWIIPIQSAAAYMLIQYSDYVENLATIHDDVASRSYAHNHYAAPAPAAEVCTESPSSSSSPSVEEACAWVGDGTERENSATPMTDGAAAEGASSIPCGRERGPGPGGIEDEPGGKDPRGSRSGVLGGGEVDVRGLTGFFLALVFLMATQDIAVDGWALTLLSPQTVSYASTCQTVGQAVGIFSSFTVFLALSDGAFCDKYLRGSAPFRRIFGGAASAPHVTGFVSLGGYMRFWGAAFAVLTVYVAFCCPEREGKGEEDEALETKPVDAADPSTFSLTEVNEERRNIPSVGVDDGDGDGGEFRPPDADFEASEMLLRVAEERKSTATENGRREGTEGSATTLPEGKESGSGERESVVEKQKQARGSSSLTDADVLETKMDELPSSSSLRRGRNGWWKTLGREVGTAYLQLWQVVRLPAVWQLSLLLLTFRIGVLTSEGASSLRLIDRGVPKESLALLVLFQFPAELFSALVAGHWVSAAGSPYPAFISGYFLRLATAFVLLNLTTFFPVVSSSPSAFSASPGGGGGALALLAGTSVLGSFVSYLAFTALCSFFNRISDPAMGGAYLTLLNTINNVGYLVPKAPLFTAMESLTRTQCYGLRHSASSGFPSSASSLSPRGSSVDASRHRFVEGLGGSFRGSFFKKLFSFNPRLEEDLAALTAALSGRLSSGGNLFTDDGMTKELEGSGSDGAAGAQWSPFTTPSAALIKLQYECPKKYRDMAGANACTAAGGLCVMESDGYRVVGLCCLAFGFLMGAMYLQLLPRLMALPKQCWRCASPAELMKSSAESPLGGGGGSRSASGVFREVAKGLEDKLDEIETPGLPEGVCDVSALAGKEKAACAGDGM